MISNTKDLSGALYSPPYKNIMSSYDKTCGFEFTPGQLKQMDLGYTALHANYQQITGSGISIAPGMLEISNNVVYDFIYTKSPMPIGSIGIQTEISSDNGISWKIMSGILDRFAIIHDVKKGKPYLLRIRSLNSLAYSPVIYYTPKYSAPLNPIANQDIASNNIGYITIPSISTLNFSAGNNSVFYSIMFNPFPMTNLTRGGNYQTNINLSAPYIGYTVIVWADENQDGDFDDTNELKYTHSCIDGNETDLSFNLHISETCDTGFVRIRIRGFAHQSTTDPYGTYRYSDIDDFILKVDNGVQAPIYCSPESANGCYGTAPNGLTYGVASFNINSVAFTNTSVGCGITSEGYSDYSSKNLDLVAGQTYSFTETNGPSQGQSKFLSIYLDANENLFFDSNELIYSHGPKIGIADPVTGTFTIPANAINGSARFRIRAYEDTIPDACTRVFYGETEDYTVIITGGKEAKVKNLSISNITLSSMDLDWQAGNTDLPDGYVISISSDGEHFTPLTTVNTATTNYQAVGLKSGIRYYFQLIASGNINSDPKIVYGTTLGIATNIDNINLANITSNSMIINWQGIGTALPIGYVINVSTDGIHFTPLATLGASATDYQAIGLESGIRYYFQLIAIGNMNSDPKIVYGTTLLVATDIIQFDLNIEMLKIFPNPVQNELYVVGSIINLNSIVGLQNILGQNLYITSIVNENGLVLNTNVLSKGIYFLTVTTGDKKQIVRFIKD